MKEYSPEPSWKTKEGKTIEIKDMEDSHIINSAKMMARNGHDWREIFGKEIRKRKLKTKEIINSESDIEYEEWCGMCSRPSYACKCHDAQEVIYD